MQHIGRAPQLHQTAQVNGVMTHVFPVPALEKAKQEYLQKTPPPSWLPVLVRNNLPLNHLLDVIVME